MPFRKRAIVEIDQNAKLSEIPDVGTWKTGVLNTNPRCFDLICTGKVQINSSDYKLKLNVSAMDKVPNFFTKNSAGEIVFAEPKPMCTIRMPRGHCGTIIVRLKSVSTEQISAKDYVCLGVRENGIITDVIYGDNGYKYIDMTDDSKVELVPLISATKLPNYTKAEIGTKVTFSNTNFDFGTVYRITIDDKQEIEWSGALTQTSGKRLRDIENNAHWYNESNGVGVGPVKGKGVRLLAINCDTGRLASSVDGANWEDEGYVNGSASSGWLTGPVYGNGIWCVVTSSGALRYSIDETKSWLADPKFPGLPTACLVFGNGIFVAVGDDDRLYTSAGANTWKNVGSIPHDDTTHRIIRYSEMAGLWIHISPISRQVYASKDDCKTWTHLVSDEGRELPSSTLWFSCCYSYGSFYALNWGNGHEIMKSSDGKNWDLELRVDASEYCITFYNGKLYAFRSDGINYYTGTFK